jgi:hypothetical protein
MCCFLMNMFGTEVWPVSSRRAFWMSAPSSSRHVSIRTTLYIYTSEAHTDLIEFDRVEIGAQIRQEVLGSFAIRAVGLAEDSCVTVSIKVT